MCEPTASGYGVQIDYDANNEYVVPRNWSGTLLYNVRRIADIDRQRNRADVLIRAYAAQRKHEDTVRNSGYVKL